MTDDDTANRIAIGDVVRDLYAAISGPAGPRDWPTSRALFHEAGRQMRTGVDSAGRSSIKIMSPGEYRKDTEPFFAKNAFYELEIKRRIDIIGNVAHVWSLYEARTNQADPSPERRGINSIQLFKDDGGRWKIVSMIWDNERPGVVVAPFAESG